MQKLEKNQKGITLIALIITIIVMIILVAVTVNVAINGGLFGTASTASQRTERDALYDQIVGAMKLTGDGKIDKTETHKAAKIMLEGQGRTVEPLQEDGTFEVIGTRGTYTYKITEEEIIKGEITGEGSGVGPESGTGENGGNPEGGDIVNPPVVNPPIEGELLQSKYTQTIGTRKIVVPVGFGVVDTTTNELLKEENYETYIAANLDNGIVVRDEEENEFVWIPVPEINDMIMCQSAETIPEGAEEGTNGRCTITLQGETLKCTKHNSEALAGRLFSDMTTGELNNFNANLEGQTYNATSGLREPAKLTDTTTLSSTAVGTTGVLPGTYAYDSQEVFTIFGGGTYSDTMYQTEFNEMATSVAKNGGFYVGRYETGGFKETKVVSEIGRGSSYLGGDGDTNNANWHKMYKMQKEFGNDIVGSSMIWGCQYDQVMKFVDGKNNFSVTEYSPNRHSGSETKGTGSTRGDFVANIYDLEGNRTECTQAAINVAYRGVRGGAYSTTWQYASVIIPENACAIGNSATGSRLALYVK